jgi:hypothetical protein
MENKNEHYYCYIFYDPRTGIPFYVGKGKGGRGWRSKANKIVIGRIRELRVLGLEQIVRAKTGLTEAEAFMVEKLLIRIFGRKDIDGGSLFNHTWGGEGISGYRHTAEHKSKMSVIHSGENNVSKRPEVKAKKLAAMNQPEAKARMSAALKIALNRPEVKAKISGDNHPMRRDAELAARHGDSIRGENNPSKRPEVRAKQSATKLGDRNPAKLESVRKKLRDNHFSKARCTCVYCLRETHAVGLARWHSHCQAKRSPSHCTRAKECYRVVTSGSV